MMRSLTPLALTLLVPVTLISLATSGLASPVLGQDASSDAAQDAAQDTAQAVVDHAIAYHGGALYEGSETSLTISSASGSFHVVSRVEGDQFLHTVTGDTAEGVERKIRSTNDRVELWLDGQPQEVAADEEQRLRDVVNARVYFPFLPYRLNDPSVSKEYLGLEEWDGRKLHKVKVTFASGTSTAANDEYLFWFRPETGRLEQFAYSFSAGNGGLRLRKGFNYRRIGGILFMDSENWGLSGQGHKVEEVTPELAANGMEKISTVTLTDIKVKAFL